MRLHEISFVRRFRRNFFLGILCLYIENANQLAQMHLCRAFVLRLSPRTQPMSFASVIDLLRFAAFTVLWGQ